METVNIITFLGLAALLVISPGPNGLLITQTVPFYGKKAGFLNITGFVVAFYIHGALAILGVSVLLLQSAHAFLIFKLLGAAYLTWIGLKALYFAFRKEKSISQEVSVTKATNIAKNKTTSKSPIMAFYEGFLTNVLNPKVSMFYLAAFPQFFSLEDSPFQALALVSLHAVINCVWFSIMILTLSRLKSYASSGRFKKWLQATTGTVFIFFGYKLATVNS